jgi:uncharacterized integral membrane protein
MKLISWLFTLIIVIFGLVFASLNSQEVIINLYFQNISLSLAILIALSIMFGAMLGWLSTSVVIFLQKRKITQLNNELTTNKKILANFRINGSDRS